MKRRYPLTDRAERLTLTKEGPTSGDWVRIEFAQKLERMLVRAMKRLASLEHLTFFDSFK